MAGFEQPLHCLLARILFTVCYIMISLFLRWRRQASSFSLTSLLNREMKWKSFSPVLDFVNFEQSQISREISAVFHFIENFSVRILTNYPFLRQTGTTCMPLIAMHLHCVHLIHPPITKAPPSSVTRPPCWPFCALLGRVLYLAFIADTKRRQCDGVMLFRPFLSVCLSVLSFLFSLYWYIQ